MRHSQQCLGSSFKTGPCDLIITAAGNRVAVRFWPYLAIVPPRLPVELRGRGRLMHFTQGRRYSFVQVGRCLPGRLSSSPANIRKAFQLFASATVLSAGLTACAPSSFVTEKSELVAPGRYASLGNDAVRRLTTEKRGSGTKLTSSGVASFYAEGTRTASGEAFDPHALTAAHRTLPFGTRLRVTDVTTGRSVIVRVNDRGPHVPGRIVDVSYSAAQMLGIVGRGTANVKIQVVQ